MYSVDCRIVLRQVYVYFQVSYYKYAYFTYLRLSRSTRINCYVRLVAIKLRTKITDTGNRIIFAWTDFRRGCRKRFFFFCLRCPRIGVGCVTYTHRPFRNVARRTLARRTCNASVLFTVRAPRNIISAVSGAYIEDNGNCAHVSWLLWKIENRFVENRNNNNIPCVCVRARAHDKRTIWRRKKRSRFPLKTNETVRVSFVTTRSRL